MTVLFCGDDQEAGQFPEFGGVENAEVRDLLAVVLIHYEFIAVLGVFGNDDGSLHVDGYSGDLGAVDLGETVERHFAVGALTTTDADKSTRLADDACLVEVVVGSHHIECTVGLGGLEFDVLIFLLVRSGEFGYILVEFVDDNLVVLQLGEELCNL